MCDEVDENRSIGLLGEGTLLISDRAAIAGRRTIHLLAAFGMPTRGFTAAVSVSWGTPPAKPLVYLYLF